jgi:tRNA pseudouridine55 synthase
VPDNQRPAPWESGLVIVDKPAGLTSHDVVARLRRLAHTRRVGHAGTLDPMATGILVIGIEKATRLLGHLMLTEKTYEATIRLGQSTTTDDAEGEPTGGAPATNVTRDQLDAEIKNLTGDIQQVPSSVSAIKVNGERAYKLTRAGQAPELAARPVTVYEFRVTATRHAGDYLDVDATVRCSSGTYVRALARDLGAALQTGGHLTALRRTAVGPYTQAHTLEELESYSSTSGEGVPANAAASVPGPVIHLAKAAAAAFPRVDLTDDEAKRLAQGGRLSVPENLPKDTPAAAFAPDGTFVALVVAEGYRLRSLAVFV